MLDNDITNPLDAGIKPGANFAVVGVDGIAEAAQWRPALSTLALTPRHLGATAVRLLLARIADPDAPIRHEMLPPALVPRAPCGKHDRG